MFFIKKYLNFDISAPKKINFQFLAKFQKVGVTTVTVKTFSFNIHFGVIFQVEQPKRAKSSTFRYFQTHMVGVGGVQDIWTLKYSGSRSIVAKIADLGPPGAPQ